jgi:hypothetical protein
MLNLLMYLYLVQSGIIANAVSKLVCFKMLS